VLAREANARGAGILRRNERPRQAERPKQAVNTPETKFARSGDIDIAYQQFGAGDRDIVMIPGWVSHVELAWELAEYASFLERLGKGASTW
jgi:hypothetical protein